MERTVQQNPGRERLVPALLLVVGLVCAFWITIGQNTAEAQQQEKQPKKTHKTDSHQAPSVTADTVSVYNRDGKRTHHYERHTTITIGEDGKPHEVTTESYDGDEASLPHMRSFSYVHPVIPVTPPHVAVFPPSMPVPAFEPFEPIEFMPPVFDVPMHDVHIDAFTYEFPPMPDIVFDTVPPHDRYRTEADIEAMQKAVLEKMKGQFGDFYGQHQAELEKLMDEVQAEMLSAQAELRAVDAERHHAILQASDYRRHDKDRVRAIRRYNDRFEAQRIERDHDAVRKQQEAVRIQQDLVREEMAKVQVMNEGIERYHTALRERLVKDGYLKNKDDMFELYESDTKMTVNGKPVKDKDFDEYRKLRKKYVKEK